VKAYSKGLAEVGDGVHAWFQPDGGWGWSNAGVVAGDGASLLVDTLFDLRLTKDMLDGIKAALPTQPIRTLVNTHANGDHWYGNQLVDGAEIVASTAAAAEMPQVPPSVLAGMVAAAPTLPAPLGDYVTRIFGSFEFEGIEPRLPDRTFDGTLEVDVGGRTVRLLELGPAHTDGDVVVHVPDAGVVFCGDLLFHGGHPIVWTGPVSNWTAACDRILALGAPTVVPGHGPLATPRALEDIKGYFEHLTREARTRFDGGMSALDAARDIDLGAYREWGEAERVVVNVTTLYRDFGAEPASDVLTLFSEMAALAAPVA
jgi:cyclase